MSSSSRIPFSEIISQNGRLSNQGLPIEMHPEIALPCLPLIHEDICCMRLRQHRL